MSQNFQVVTAVVSKHVLCCVLIKLQAYILQLLFNKDTQAQTVIKQLQIL